MEQKDNSYPLAMATSDDINTFLEVMTNLHTLSDLNAAKTVASELLALRKRDQESSTVIYRLTEDNAWLIQRSKAAADESRTLNSKVKDLQENLTKLKKDWTEINRVADERGRKLRDESAKVTQLEQHRVNLERGLKDEVYVRGPI